jgi:release factor glutamine methyltransferase
LTVASPSVTAGQRLRAAVSTLEAAGIETGRVDAEWLLAGVLGVRRSALHLVLARELPVRLARRYGNVIRRRAAREPLQQILGWEEFRGLRLEITRGVLVPRPETEMLVDWALALLPADGRRRVVVDVGTGSGSIACAMARERAEVEVVALDLAWTAARLARRNVARLGYQTRVRIVVGDLVSALDSASADLIVANPPYLTSAMLAATPPEVREHEPPQALDGGADGLGVIRPLALDARRVLGPGGALVVETAGGAQVDAVASLFGDAGYAEVAVRADLAGVRRFVSGRRP